MYNEMSQRLEDLHNFMNEHFQNDQCMMLL